MEKTTVKRSSLRQYSGVGDKFLMGFIYFLLIFILLVILLPIVNIVASSFSSASAVTAGKVTLWPVDFSLEGYKAVFNNHLIVGGFINSFKIMVLGTLINLFVTLIAAFPLSFPLLPGRKFITLLFSFTMFFGGGTIPSYLVVRNLGMVDTIWSMVIPGALSVYNMIIARTFMQSSIPMELYESAEIDGASHFRVFLSITLPLSKALMAVLTLMFAVGHWNSYFGALIYLRTQDKFPLQLVLRQILVINTFSLEEMTGGMAEEILERQYLGNLLKYSVIVVASAPMLMIYPFVQKHFVKGVMLGSLKG